jgi:pSer/pThr/pTyr-binding forkhead associated (FHA) protein
MTGPRAGERLSLVKDCFLIGRAAFCDLVLTDANVSRQHSVIELVAGAFWLLDMGSTNGPVIRGQRVARHQLANGDTFSIGDTLIRYEEGPPRMLH